MTQTKPDYDYVIVGGGSAGSVLAARLSEDPQVSVCLLEAGGGGKSILIRAPAAAVFMLPGWGKINNWAFKTERQKALNNRRGYQPRGRTLGGSSAINAMLYVRGHRDDYDGWAALGCKGWSWDEVLPYFRISEGNVRGADDLHGADGPLQISDQQSPRPISRAFVAAAGEMQHKLVDDFNRGDSEGAGLYQVNQFHATTRRGERCSVAAAYLHPAMARPNLTVITHARATRILLDGKRATGVAYQQGRVDKEVMASREVILCGGAFNSPHLLLLSGIGPADEIKAQGITPVHDLSGVGRNLQDHLDNILGYRSPDKNTFGISLSATRKMYGHIRRWRRDGGGMVATPFAEAGAFLKTEPTLKRPNIQLHFVIAILDDHARKQHLGHGFTCHVCVLNPASRGRVFLKAADPMAAPGIDPGFLSDPQDLDALIQGSRLTHAILEAPALAAHRARAMHGITPEMSDAEWESYIRARADTVYHPVGTCKMGVDDLAVVDPELRVRGVAGLRVVDASVMPVIPGGNTNAPVVMIAEKAADMIRGS